MAEAFYNNLTKSHDAISAGADPYPLGSAAPTVIAAMKEKGIDLHHHSQLVTREMVDNADVVIAFPTPLMPDFVLHNPKTTKWDISDPYYQQGDIAVHTLHARDSIEYLVKELVEHES